MILLSLLYRSAGRPQKPQPVPCVRTVYPDGWHNQSESQRNAETFKALEQLHNQQPELTKFELAAKTYLTWKNRNA